MSKNTKYLINKTLVNLAIIIIGALFMFGVLKTIEMNSALSRQVNESNKILEQISNVIEENTRDADELTELYHAGNTATVFDMKRLFTSGLFDDLASTTTEERSRILSEVIDSSGVEYLYIIDSNGMMVLTPDEHFTGRYMSDMNLITDENLKVLTSGEGSHVFETNETGNYYFYSAKLKSDPDYWMVLGASSDVLELEFSSLRDISMVLKNATVGNDGFVFAVNTEDKSFAYFQNGDTELTGKNALECGIEEEALVNGYSGSQNIEGQEYFCVMRSCAGYLIVCAALSTDSLYMSNIYSLLWSVFGFVLVSLICLIYAFIVRNDINRKRTKIDKKPLFKFENIEVYYNHSVGKKIFPLMLTGLIMVFGISYYVQTLLVLSNSVAVSDSVIKEVENREDNLITIKNDITSYYENQFLSKTKLLAYFLEEDPSVLNIDRTHIYTDYDEDGNKIFLKDSEGNLLTSIKRSEGLTGYAYDNGIRDIYVYDENGRTIATTNDEWYFTISNNPDDQSYIFKDVLDGKKDCLVQDRMSDELGRDSQYIASAFTYYTCTENGETKYVSKYNYESYLDGKWTGSPITRHQSMVQINLDADLMERLVSSTKLESVVSQNNQMMMLFDNSEDHTVLYSYNPTDIKKVASEIGVSDKAFSGNYNGFQRINGEEFFQTVRYYNDFYISTLMSKNSIYEGRFKVAFNTSACSFIFIIIMSMLITISSDKEDEVFEELYEKAKENPESTFFAVMMPSGRESITKKAEARWDNRHIPWNDKTAEQKLGTIILDSMALVIAVIFVMLVIGSRSFSDNSVIRYIISGNWDHGLNIFAMTACCLIIITAIVSVQLVSIPVNLVSSIFGTKSETIGHLVISVFKYGGFLVALFYCLYLMGFDSSSLLASAGILSLVIGLGAQSLIKDIIAGIFIVFEGEFRVGDIVSIGGYRGQVLDIGLRTTKIMSDDQNIKIIKNNDVSGVINMTRVLSVFTVDFSFDFGESIEKIEEILAKELPGIYDRVATIASGPVYKGISKFDQRTITMTIEASCKEKDMNISRSALIKELINIFYQYGINIKK